MNEVHHVPMGSFLRERKNRYSPEEANKLDLRKVAKIDFSGNIHLSDSKTTQTGMILIKNGDLVISGINVEKGAISVYSGEEDVLATIHYSSYSIDECQIVVEYLKWFLKSKIFKQIIRSRGKVGIKTELKPKKFLELVIPLPDLDGQRKVLEKLESFGKKIKELIQLTYLSEKYLKRLRLSILRDAISGKLVPQDPKDEPAIEILKKLAEEKKLVGKKIPKIENSPSNESRETPFNLPKGWEWSRLGDICYDVTSGSTPSKDHFRLKGGIPYLKVYNIVKNKIAFHSRPQYIDEAVHRTKNRRSILHPGDVVMNIVGPPLGKIAIIPDSYPEWNCNQAMVFFRPLLNEMNNWIYLFLSEGSFLKSIELVGTVGQDNISVTKSKNIPIPIPPLAEQKRIIEKVDQIEKFYDKLLGNTKKNQENSEFLMEALLEEAFAS